MHSSDGHDFHKQEARSGSVRHVFDVAVWIESGTAVLATRTPSLLVAVFYLQECFTYEYTSRCNQLHQLHTHVHLYMQLSRRTGPYETTDNAPHGRT